MYTEMKGGGGCYREDSEPGLSVCCTQVPNLTVWQQINPVVWINKFVSRREEVIRYHTLSLTFQIIFVIQ